MRLIIVILSVLFITSFSYAQDNFPKGEWKFEKLPDDAEIDEEGAKMMTKMFSEFTLSFDENNYNLFMMGGTETGTWKNENEDTYELMSSKGRGTVVRLEKVDEDHLLFFFNADEDKPMQMMRTGNIVSIEKEENVIESAEGIDIDKDLLVGKWNYVSQIKNGVESDLMFKHNETEGISWSFSENGELLVKAPLEVELLSTWEVKEDKQTLVNTHEDGTELMKVVRLTETELHLSRPGMNLIIKFKK